jgi:hypothetical protein
VVGIKQEMKAGTEEGRAFSATLSDAKGDLESLASTAAKNVLGPLQGAVADLDERMPGLNGQIGELATVTGKAGEAVVGGLLSGFQALEPLMRDGAVYVLNLSQRFQGLMSGPGIVSFGDYVRSVLPQVMSTLESIVRLAGNLVSALAPLGGGTLSAIKTLADLINAIPTDVLQVVATSASAVFIGFRAWQGLSGLIAGVSTAMGRLGVEASVAATAVRGMQAAAGLIGIALAGLSFLFTANAEATRQNEEAANAYADALKRSNGVIDESIRQMTAKQLADDGVLEAARKLGIALPDVTDAALGNADAQARVNAVIGEQSDKLKVATTGWKSGVQANTDLGDAADKVTGAIGRTNGQLDAGIQKNKDISDATAIAAGNTSGAANAMDILAGTYGASASTFEGVISAQQKVADKAAAATVQMQLENDAAGLLKQSLDLLNGDNMSAAQSQNAFESAQNSVGSQIKQAQEAEARARKALADAQNPGTSGGSGGPSKSSTDSLARAQLQLAQAQAHLNRVRSDPKASPSALESANQRLARAQLAVSQAQGRVSDSASKAAGSTGKLDEKQIAEAKAALKQAEANTKAAKAFTGNSEAAVSNRAHIINAIALAEQSAEAYGKQTGSTEKAREKLITLKDEIIKNAAAQGLNKDEVTKFVNELLKIPASVPPTKADLDTKAALAKKKALQDAINAITGKTVTVSIQQVFSTLGSNAARQIHNEQTMDRHGHNPALATGGPIPGFAVGTLIGPGTGTSDSILAQVAQTGRLLRVSAGEFVSTDASRRRNRAALEAGNRGATLEVAGAGRGRMHPDDIDAIVGGFSKALRNMKRPVVDTERLSTSMVGDI